MDGHHNHHNGDGQHRHSDLERRVAELEELLARVARTLRGYDTDHRAALRRNIRAALERSDGAGGEK